MPTWEGVAGGANNKLLCIRPRQKNKRAVFCCQLREHVALPTCSERHVLSTYHYVVSFEAMALEQTCSQRHAKFAYRCAFKYSVFKSTVYLPTLHRLICI
jgi:hypothetical protein